MTTVLPKQNLRILTFSSSIADSSGRPVPGTSRTHNLVFNCTKISEEEVERLIDNSSWELDNRVIDIPTSILNNLQDSKTE